MRNMKEEIQLTILHALAVSLLLTGITCLALADGMHPVACTVCCLWIVMAPLAWAVWVSEKGLDDGDWY